jgi:hypothetical protein
MKGLDRITAIRRRGFRPPCVTLWPHQHCQVDDETWLHWEPKDVPELMDLRPLVGLFVTVMADGEEADRWARAAMKAGAKTVIAVGSGLLAKGGDYRLNGLDMPL